MRTLIYDAYSIFWREMKHFWDQKIRILVTIFQPFLWLALMGNMMSGFTNNPFGRMALGGVNYIDFMTPGIIVMTSLFGGIFGGTSVVWDRRWGFLNRVLSSPISRTAIPLGKMLATALQGAIQAVIIVIIATLFGVKFATGIFGILVIILLASCFNFTMAGLSIAIASRLRNMETLFAVMNLFTMPLMFTSSAMFPINVMPNWLATIAKWNPVTYVVNPLRTLVISGWNVEDIVKGFLYVLSLAIIMMFVARHQFKKSIA
ncbi:MAG: ABC transporter [Dictyoglomus sp. NZ13-RE01]|nr:MAG: ABC transporter [Dictyoglomus sp. NZ13-RE01]